jgi:2-iminobutanoate/2-iminopropanoate deaminase
MRECLNPFPPTQVNGKVVPNTGGIRTEQYLFVKGMLGHDPQSGELASDEIRGQTHQAIANVRSVLEAGGTSLERIVTILVQLVNRADFDAFNEVYASYFPSDPPARTVMLTGIARDGAVVELTATALA